MVTDAKNYRDGFSDGLIPLEPIDVTRVDSVDGLLRQYANTAFGGRALGEALDVFETMVRDPECLVVLTLSGAMTVAKQGLLVCEMIDRGWVHAVVSTGAIMSHGLVESLGGSHFKYDTTMDDVELYGKGYDRVYDTLELEQNLDDSEKIVRRLLGTMPDDQVLYSELIHREIGRFLDETLKPDQRAILRSAYQKQVPVYVPAFTDSELGLDVALHNQARVRAGKKRRFFDPYLDLESYARLVTVQERTGIFTIGGGVPRNWAQQAGPFLDLIEKRMGLPGRGFRFRYGIRICPEPVHWGGLSGCTYSEGVSWGKFVPTQEGGRFSEVLCDATIAWPLLVRALMERVGETPVDKKLRSAEQNQDVVLTLG